MRMISSIFSGNISDMDPVFSQTCLAWYCKTLLTVKHTPEYTKIHVDLILL